ncbi:hypothetical protein [Deinococcus marmoris]|uniref:hypothetical protein n=1 Tax=Deinococcus marmoris TaxID=249408 RepID=UPI000497A595|nr:hypothetical protein [Deinococcus marmoris]
MIRLDRQHEEALREILKLFIPHRIGSNIIQEEIGEQPVFIGGQLQMETGLILEGCPRFSG